MTISILHYSDPEFTERLTALREALRGGVTASSQAAVDVPAVVRDIIAQVRDRGDQALLELTEKFDHAKLEPYSIVVSADEIEQAHSNADPEFLELVRTRHQEHPPVPAAHPHPASRAAGDRRALLSVRYTPVRRAGLYVPGGRAMYPSTVLMTVVPAQVAGVEEIAIVSPPTAGGTINPMVLALAGELGINEVYRVGGAQAVAALALGTQTIATVDKIVGPGNAFVAEAKRQLLGTVGIDSIAGPSEVLIIADDTADPACVAADLIARPSTTPAQPSSSPPPSTSRRPWAASLPRRPPNLIAPKPSPPAWRDTARSWSSRISSRPPTSPTTSRPSTSRSSRPTTTAC